MIKMISSKFGGMGVRGEILCAKKKTDAPARRVEFCGGSGHREKPLELSLWEFRRRRVAGCI